jgi:hypothetical protein
MNKVPASLFLFKDLAADCPIFNVFTIPEVITLAIRRFPLTDLVVKALRVSPQFDGVALKTKD